MTRTRHDFGHEEGQRHQRQQTSQHVFHDDERRLQERYGGRPDDDFDLDEESFRDYARLIKENPRYEKAESVAQSGSAMAYASALQKAGYATDPEYARKLSGAINSVLRTQRAQT